MTDDISRRADSSRRGKHPADPDNRTWPAAEPEPSKRRTLGGGMDQQPGRQCPETTGEAIHDAAPEAGDDHDSAGYRRRDGD
jgi:hypothetical protein